jgi:hypothetical protein
MRVRLKREPVVVYKRSRKAVEPPCRCRGPEDAKSKEDILEALEGDGSGLLKNGVHPLHRVFRSPAEGSSPRDTRCERCAHAEA